jgi:TonB family protein
VSFSKSAVWFTVLALAIGGGVARAVGQDAAGEGEIVRRAKTKVQPVYPDLARKMNLTGSVKVEVVVATNGTVKSAKVVGGHPVLASAALEAVKKWKFEPAAVETTGVVDFKFDAH